MDPGSHPVSMNGKELNLTPTEFRLPQALMESRGRTMSRMWSPPCRITSRRAPSTCTSAVFEASWGKWATGSRPFGGSDMGSSRLFPPLLRLRNRRDTIAFLPKGACSLANPIRGLSTMRRSIITILSLTLSLVPTDVSGQDISARSASIRMGGRIHAQYSASSVPSAVNDFFFRRAGSSSTSPLATS